MATHILAFVRIPHRFSAFYSSSKDCLFESETLPRCLLFVAKDKWLHSSSHRSFLSDTAGMELVLTQQQHNLRWLQLCLCKPLNNEDFHLGTDTGAAAAFSPSSGTFLFPSEAFPSPATAAESEETSATAGIEVTRIPHVIAPHFQKDTHQKCRAGHSHCVCRTNSAPHPCDSSTTTLPALRAHSERWSREQPRGFCSHYTCNSWGCYSQSLGLEQRCRRCCDVKAQGKPHPAGPPWGAGTSHGMCCLPATKEPVKECVMRYRQQNQHGWTGIPCRASSWLCARRALSEEHSIHLLGRNTRARGDPPSLFGMLSDVLVLCQKHFSCLTTARTWKTTKILHPNLYV